MILKSHLREPFLSQMVDGHPWDAGPPRDNFILRPEELQWSEQDFLGGGPEWEMADYNITSLMGTCFWQVECGGSNS